MKNLLAALARWNPPDGTIAGLSLEVSPADGACRVAIRIDRPHRPGATVRLDVSYVDGQYASPIELLSRLTAAAIEALVAANAEPGPPAAPPTPPAPAKPVKARAESAA